VGCQPARPSATGGGGLARRPAGEVEEQAVRRAAGRFGVAPVRSQARVIVAGAVDLVAQRLLVIRVVEETAVDGR
jgi:hypothetical protein